MRLVQQTTQMLPACHLLLLVLLQNIWRCCGQSQGEMLPRWGHIKISANRANHSLSPVIHIHSS